MKKISSVALCCLSVAAIGAGAAVAENSTPNPKQVASQACTTELHVIGVKQFKMKYGDPHKSGDPAKAQHAMRNCKGKKSNSSENLVNDAAQECKAEQADPNFATTHGGQTFDQVYGTNHNQQNSFGKCVSGKVHAALGQIETNLQNAAQACRAERSDPNFAAGHGGKTFSEFYGTEKSKRKNAFGKCVSQKAKAQGSAPAPTT
ncbi:MAG TPA: hypothetical protein VF052_08935 [Solirubrobacterales bacterium]